MLRQNCRLELAKRLHRRNTHIPLPVRKLRDDGGGMSAKTAGSSLPSVCNADNAARACEASSTHIPRPASAILRQNAGSTTASACGAKPRDCRLELAKRHPTPQYAHSSLRSSRR